jgi:hypothetical protein
MLQLVGRIETEGACPWLHKLNSRPKSQHPPSKLCAAYKRYGPLKVFVQSILNQTAGNWKLTVHHDGPDEEFERVMQSFSRESGGRISYKCSVSRHNDWGHSLRAEGLKSLTSDYVLMTNGDNYYVPPFIQFVTGKRS